MADGAEFGISLSDFLTTDNQKKVGEGMTDLNTACQILENTGKTFTESTKMVPNFTGVKDALSENTKTNLEKFSDVNKEISTTLEATVNNGNFQKKAKQMDEEKAQQKYEAAVAAAVAKKEAQEQNEQGNS